MLIPLKDEAAPGKYGLVTVYEADGTFNREYKITGPEYAALATQGGAPPGFDSEDRNQGRRWVAFGKDFEVGDAAEQHDGVLLVKYAEDVVDGRFVESFVKFRSNEWTGRVNQVTVTRAVIDAIQADLDLETRRQTGGREIVALTDGVLEYR